MIIMEIKKGTLENLLLFVVKNSINTSFGF